MENQKHRMFRALIAILAVAVSLAAEAKSRKKGHKSGGRTTSYYTMVSSNGKINRRECGMEGNQIVDGNLIGSNCRKYKDRYCPYAVGNHDNCLVPCVHAAGPYKTGTRKNVPGFTCPWGPLKGLYITSVIIGDSGPGHVDVFKGLCMKKSKGDECTEYAPETMMASYGSGKGKELEIAASLADQYYKPGVGALFLARIRNSDPTKVAATSDANAGGVR
jgi:hypothetical protein